MTTELEITPELRAALQGIQHGTLDRIEPDYNINVRDFREIPLPRFLSNNLPEGTSLSVTSLPVQQLGSLDSAVALRFSIPIDFGGPRRIFQ